MTDATYAVGIDLGTTHCVMSAARLDRPVVRLQLVPQLVSPGEVAEQPLLPSFLYLPVEGELSDADRTLPWGPGEHVVGELARRMGARVPNRLVASAKSWVCHGGVNRRAPILPWAAPDEEPHVSPFEAQVAYLAHLRAVWNATHPDAALHDQDVVVTVPASFDEGARELTTQAAEAAGLGSVRLIEEPQAAFYDFLGAHGEDLDARLADAKLILVVDVGGGTTDLTLLRVLPPGSAQRIERIAVGGHLMLGGDNMDAALAMFALEKANMERPRDATIWSGLVQQARQAKERLLGENPPESVTVTVQARGSRLIAGTRSIAIEREEASRVLLDGFLPHTGPAEVGQRAARAGLTTLGLPYTSDVAIGRHVCAFLRRHAAAAIEAGARVDDGLPRPDLLLLNGGVWNAAALVRRLSEVLTGWYGEPVPMLPHTSLETAVAHGAVRSALARRGLGEVIGGGTARAYYIGVEGREGAAQALCIAPRGMDEGVTVNVPDRVFELVTDRAVAFPLYVYTGDRVDAAGALVEPSDELEPLPGMETVVRDKERGGGTVPVTLEATLTEAGALEVYLVTVALPPRRWRLPFALAAAPSEDTDEDEDDDDEAAPQIDDARALLQRVFASDDPKRIKAVRRDVEQVLGPRGQWSAATCRALWEGCMDVEAQRGRSGEHELNWLRLAGWCLRPGFGAPDDEARLDRMWAVRERGLVQASKANWAEWWILWRRIAPGLDATRQLTLWEDVQPWLWRPAKPPAGPHKHGPVEMMQLLAALELLPVEAKVAIGDLLLERAKKIGSYWPLGRVGARALLRREASDLVVSPEVAARWLKALLALDWKQTEGASFAAASIARVTGDATRDVDAGLRKDIADRLAKADAPAPFVDMVLRATALGEGDLRSVLGESLPVGLRLT